VQPIWIVPLLGVALAPAPPPSVCAPPRVRGLTDGERSLLRPLFGDAVDYDAIRIVRGRAFALQGDRTYVTLGHRIYAPGPLYRVDFAAAGAQRQAILVHEVAHVWQSASGIPVVASAVLAFVAAGGHYERAYRYALIAGRDLLDYGIEQQASILADYFLASGRTAERYRGVLRRFLADPKYAARPRPRPRPGP
jgi:hypothetical protein